MKEKNHPTSADLDRSRGVVESELQQARDAHAKAAYACAVDRENEAARSALADTQKAIASLTAELEGISAARGEAQRLEGIGALDRDIETIERNRRATHVAADHYETAFDAFNEVVKQFKSALTALVAAEEQLYASEQIVAEMPQGINFYSRTVRSEPVVDALMFWALDGFRELNPQRTETIMDMGGRWHLDGPREAVREMTSKARFFVDSGAKSAKARVEAERSQLTHGLAG